METELQDLVFCQLKTIRLFTAGERHSDNSQQFCIAQMICWNTDLVTPGWIGQSCNKRACLPFEIFRFFFFMREDNEATVSTQNFSHQSKEDMGAKALNCLSITWYILRSHFWGFTLRQAFSVAREAVPVHFNHQLYFFSRTLTFWLDDRFGQPHRACKQGEERGCWRHMLLLLIIWHLVAGDLWRAPPCFFAYKVVLVFLNPCL